jgi:hypothetical protein
MKVNCKNEGQLQSFKREQFSIFTFSITRWRTAELLYRAVARVGTWASETGRSDLESPAEAGETARFAGIRAKPARTFLYRGMLRRGAG